MSKSKILLLLVVFLLISPLSNLFTVSAAPVVASGKCGDNLTWERTSDGVLTISGSGAMYDYDEVTKPAPWGSGAEVVIIGDEVTRIGEKAFFGGQDINSITIGKNVTSIGYAAFAYQYAITEVHISDVASWLNINFEGSDSNPMSFYYAELYLNNERITDLVIPEGIKEIKKYAFYNCLQLKSVTIPASVTKIGKDAFAYCESLTDVYISDIAAWCNIDFESSVFGLNSNPLKYADSLWLNNEPITELYLPDNTTSIKSNAFYGYKQLKSITIPDSVTSIGRNAFYGCSNLANITIPDSVTSIGIDAFSTTAYYNNTNNWTNGDLYIDNHLIRADSSVKGAYSVRNGTITIGGDAFSDCSDITNITLPDSIQGIGDSAFYNCSSLSEITIPDNITSIGNSIFYGCSSLAELTIPDKVTSIGRSAFSGCSSLSEIIIPNTITTIGSYAFSGCSNLSEITLPDTLNIIESYTFQKCTSLTTITIPQEITNIGYAAFNGCTRLSTINYTGSPDDWDSIYIQTSNSPLRKATINYLPGKPLATNENLIPLTGFEAEDGHEYAVKYGDNIVSGDGIAYDYAKHGAYQIFFGKYVSNSYKKPKAQGIKIKSTTYSGDVVTDNCTAKTPFSSGAPFGILIFGANFRNGLTAENYIEY